MKISYVIPCYCSEKTIKSVVQEIQNKMNEMSDYFYEIILVNDCSPDNTFAVIGDLCAHNQNIIGVGLAARRFNGWVSFCNRRYCCVYG